LRAPHRRFTSGCSTTASSGHYVRDWEKNRSIPLSAKILAVVTMSASLAWLALATNAPAIAVWTTGAILACVAAWLVTRPTSKL
jgi:uncharacterized membrane protein YbaN (DUF454 family)